MGKGNKSTPSKKEKKYAENRARIASKYGSSTATHAVPREATSSTCTDTKPGFVGLPLPKATSEHPWEYRQLNGTLPLSGRLLGVVTSEEEIVTKTGLTMQSGDVAEASGHSWNWIGFGNSRWKVGEKVSFSVSLDRKTRHPRAEKLLKIEDEVAFGMAVV